MKRTTYIKSVTGSIIQMNDGTAWEIIDPINGPRVVPNLLPLMKVETEDLGPDRTVTIVGSGKVLKARKLRAET